MWFRSCPSSSSVRSFCFSSLTFFALLQIFVHFAYGLYSSSSDVVQLTDQNFAEEVIQSDGVSIVEFYAPWCGHSKKAKPEMDKLISKHDGTTMDGVNIKCSIVDSEAQKEETKKQGVQGFPTFKAHLLKDGKELTNYVLELPERTLSALEGAVKEAVDKIKSM